jgi:hypothetical protein
VNVAEFVEKWRRVELTERSAAQQLFLDLCEVFEHPKPAAVDSTGESFTFEKGASKEGGGDGWADVWRRGFFGWELKGRHKDLDAAYRQLLLYREAPENPPLLVVWDRDRTKAWTDFSDTSTDLKCSPHQRSGRPQVSKAPRPHRQCRQRLALALRLLRPSPQHPQALCQELLDQSPTHST